jgi:hypothetical protein
VGATGTLLLLCASDAMSDAFSLSDKLARRGFEAAIKTDRQTGASDALVVLLDRALAKHPGLGSAILEANAANQDVFVLRLAGASKAALADPVLADTIRVNALGDDRNRDLSRFANVIAEHLAAGQAIAAADGAAGGAAFLPPVARLGWSWDAVAFGPLWTFYRALPLQGLFCILFLAAAVIVAAQMQASFWAPLIGFVAGWLILSIALGATTHAMLPASDAETTAVRQSWFRPAGMAGLVGVIALTAFLMIENEPLFDAASGSLNPSPAPQPLASRSGPSNPLMVGVSGADYGVGRPAGNDGALVLAPGALTDQSGASLDQPDGAGLAEPPVTDRASSRLPNAPPPGGSADRDDANVLNDIFDAGSDQNQCCS